jgi:hypothetical protein
MLIRIKKLTGSEQAENTLVQRADSGDLAIDCHTTLGNVDFWGSSSDSQIWKKTRAGGAEMDVRVGKTSIYLYCIAFTTKIFARR